MRSADEANRRYFRDAYGTGDHGWAVEEPSGYVVDFLDRVRRNVPGGRLLDLGCGEGRHAIAAARLGFRVTAVDYEPRALERARRFAQEAGADNTRFVVADALRPPFAESSFDVVLDYGCLHHQKKADWPAYKSNLLRVLKPDGFYLLSAFSPRFRFFRGSKRRWHIARGAYRRCFTASDIKGLFRDEFEILEMLEESGEGRGLWHALMRRRAEK
ncbi:MAG: class I SAM-dependent methyltransferase [Candidatus Brocadiia bacterium]